MRHIDFLDFKLSGIAQWLQNKTISYNLLVPIEIHINKLLIVLDKMWYRLYEITIVVVNVSSAFDSRQGSEIFLVSKNKKFDMQTKTMSVCIVEQNFAENRNNCVHAISQLRGRGDFPVFAFARIIFQRDWRALGRLHSKSTNLLYRYKRAMTSRTTVLNIRKLYLYFVYFKVAPYGFSVKSEK